MVRPRIDPIQHNNNPRIKHHRVRILLVDVLRPWEQRSLGGITLSWVIGIAGWILGRFYAVDPGTSGSAFWEVEG